MYGVYTIGVVILVALGQYQCVIALVVKLAIVEDFTRRVVTILLGVVRAVLQGVLQV